MTTNSDGGRVHVNSYTRGDGTEVKDYWRGGGSSENAELTDSGTTLEGHVEENVIAEDALTAADNTLDIASKIESLGESSGGAIMDELKLQLDDGIKSMKDILSLAKTKMDDTLQKLVDTKDQKEYSELFKKYVSQKDSYEKNSKAMTSAEYFAKKENYQDVIKELHNFRSDFQEVVKKNRAERPINTTPANPDKNSSALPNYSPATSPYMTPNMSPNSILPMAQKGVVDIGMGVYNSLYSDKLNDAKEMWKAASHDFKQSADYISKNTNMIYSVSQLPSDELRQTVQNKLKNQLGVDDSVGMIFREDSSLSKSIVNSQEFKTHIKNNLSTLLQGGTVKEASTYFGSDKNLKLALGHADILYTSLDKHGNLHAAVLDTYDFNKNDKDWKVRWARNTQDAGLIRNYYTLSPIFIDKVQLENLFGK